MNAQEARRSISAEQRAFNSKRLPIIASRTRKAMEEPSFCIYNVGPWVQTKSFGSMGVYTIGACPENEPFIKMKHYFGDPAELVDWFPEVIHDYVPDDESSMKAHEYEGRYIAEQFVGTGKMLSPYQVLTKYGVGVAAGLDPTKKELKVSNDLLNVQLEKFIQEARDAWAAGPSEARMVISKETHFVAARRLNMSDEPWMKFNSAKQRQQCPMCGTYTDLGIIKCSGSNCGWVFDEEAYVSMMLEQKRRIEARLSK